MAIKEKYSLLVTPDDRSIGCDIVYFDRLALAKQWFNAKTTFACTRTLRNTLSNKTISHKHFDADLTPKDHSQDEDCQGHIENDVCNICGAGFGDPCPECHQRAYHRHDCSLSDENN